MDSAQLDLLDYSPDIRRDTAIATVAAHADENHSGWTTLAYNWICKYAETQAFFISEECTQAALAAGVPAAHDSRAWGAPFKQASRDGIICKHGYGTSKRRNLSPCPMWRSCHANFARSA